MPRSAAEPKGARHARGLDGTAPVWPPHGASHRHQQKHQRYSRLNASGAKLPPACHPLQANKIKRLSHREPTMAPSERPLVPSKTMCRQPLSATLAAVLLSCPPKVPMPPRPISFAHAPLAAAHRAADSAEPHQKSCGRHADSMLIQMRVPMRFTPGFDAVERQIRDDSAPGIVSMKSIK